MLRGRIVEGPQGFLARGEAGFAQTPRGAAQLVLDAVLHGACPLRQAAACASPQPGRIIARTAPPRPRGCPAAPDSGDAARSRDPADRPGRHRSMARACGSGPERPAPACCRPSV